MSLSPAWQQVVRRMQVLGYGEIERLVVCSGEPCLDPPPEPEKTVVLPDDGSPCAEAFLTDFVLKREVLALVHAAKKMGDCTFKIIFVRKGLPVRFKVKEPWSGAM